MEAGTRAFVSYVRGYKEHHCKYIFRIQVRGKGRGREDIECRQRGGEACRNLLLQLLPMLLFSRAWRLGSWPARSHCCACRYPIVVLAANYRSSASAAVAPQDMAFGRLATSFALLRLPRMPEIKKARGQLEHFTASEVDVDAIRFKDKSREKQRQQVRRERAGEGEEGGRRGGKDRDGDYALEGQWQKARE